jgi:hypothetical protein
MKKQFLVKENHCVVDKSLDDDDKNEHMTMCWKTLSLLQQVGGFKDHQTFCFQKKKKTLALQTEQQSSGL